MTYGLGREIPNPHVADWEPINAVEPVETPGIVQSWSTETYSHTAHAFRQEGGNANGDDWERYYQAVPCPANVWPSHTV